MMEDKPFAKKKNKDKQPWENVSYKKLLHLIKVDSTQIKFCFEMFSGVATKGNG